MGAEEKSYIDVEFNDDAIVLSVPMPEGTDVEEWKLIPLVPSKVSLAGCVCLLGAIVLLLQLSRKRVDNFTSKGKMKVPSCQLQATLSHKWRGYIPERSHLLTLQGAREPDNQMVLALAAVNFSKSTVISLFSTEHGLALVQRPGNTYTVTLLMSSNCNEMFIAVLCSSGPSPYGRDSQSGDMDSVYTDSWQRSLFRTSQPALALPGVKQGNCMS